MALVLKEYRFYKIYISVNQWISEQFEIKTDSDRMKTLNSKNLLILGKTVGKTGTF